MLFGRSAEGLLLRGLISEQALTVLLVGPLGFTLSLFCLLLQHLRCLFRSPSEAELKARPDHSGRREGAVR